MILSMVVSILAATWTSEARAAPDQARQLAGMRHVMDTLNLDSIGTAGGVEALSPGRGGNDKLVQVAPATASDMAQSPAQEPHWRESLSCELTNARRDIELLHRFERERDRAEWLEQGLAAARRDVETQTALTAKAIEEAGRAKRAA
ncbi:hypothetical protein [Bradyrhizobium jicamae]|uniref:hypothetical protein n=1 Tax=Bradyrhizobium jicamae TaxID=280332 RepID=UPI001BA855C2|nr:hypothetical protein [Bradyrhizobium jicamae]MBR0935669.1 hypothetical protein [Bradyrhizobium jicamae]